MTLPDFSMKIRVYYEDTDAGGVVFYANYLKFAERARTEMLRETGYSHTGLAAAHDFYFVVRHCSIDYHAPARLDDLLDVSVRVVAVGGASMEMAQDIWRDGHLLARLDVKLACVGKNGRPVRIPAALRHGMESGKAHES
ncbi:MAG TPA: tol-pal system-associated acyl-CoA thioesterase [Rhodospirillaceae bacterium]|nr:MAG: tol-pal system-associated acyl-CoA thioesterase [Alphaproteobacteria bacterium GWF2_58_20]HAU29058.1 tol-pal system-associated acyl-CoA thioesterase [Rhodospirillaceae bacterium]